VDAHTSAARALLLNRRDCAGCGRWQAENARKTGCYRRYRLSWFGRIDDCSQRETHRYQPASWSAMCDRTCEDAPENNLCESASCAQSSAGCHDVLRDDPCMHVAPPSRGNGQPVHPARLALPFRAHNRHDSIRRPLSWRSLLHGGLDHAVGNTNGRSGMHHRESADPAHSVRAVRNTP